MLKNRTIFILTFMLILISISTYGQPAGGGPPGSNPPPCWPPPCVPIDGGIGFLIALGAAIGIKKIYFTKNNSKT